MSVLQENKRPQVTETKRERLFDELVDTSMNLFVHETIASPKTAIVVDQGVPVFPINFKCKIISASLFISSSFTFLILLFDAVYLRLALFN